MSRTFLARSLALTSICAWALCSAAGLDDISLARKPQLGNVAEYLVTGIYDSTDPKAPIKFSETLNQKITVVRPDGGFELTSTATNVLVSLGDQKMDQPDSVVVSEQDANGRIRSLLGNEASDASAFRLAHLQVFESPANPVKVGDEIKYTIPGDKTLGSPPVDADYKVDGLEKIKTWDTARLTFTAQETEGDTKSSMAGTIWVSTADGSLVKSESKWTDVQPPAAPTPLTGKVSLIRTK